MTQTTYSQPPDSQLGSTRATGSDNVVNLKDYADAKAKDAAILAWAKLQYNRCKEQRIPTERDWYVKLAFFMGKHNIQMIISSASTNGFQMVVPKAPPWRVRLVVNRMRGVIRKQVALLVQQKPKFYALPASTEDSDLMSARVAEAILEAFYRENDLQTNTRHMAWWGSICGTSFMKTYWDKYKKDESGTKGSIITEAIDPFHIYVPDLLQQEIELQPYVIHATTINPEMAEKRYSTPEKQCIFMPNVTAAASILDDQFLNLSGVQNSKKDQVLNLEFWIKPNMFKLFPKGGILTVCGDQVVQFIEGDVYSHGEFPFAKFTDMDSGKFYGDSILSDLIPLQRELNRTRSQVTEAKNLMAKPKLLAPRGSINANQITSEPGQVIYYNPGFEKPIPIPLTPLPAYVLEELDRFQRDIEDLSGQHDISRLISSRTSATALSYVQNADSMMMQAATQSLEKAIEKTGRQIISLVRQFWTVSRTVKVVGTDDAFETQEWKGTDVHDNTTVFVETGSALPQDKAARQAFLMDLLKMGAIQPQQMLEMLDIGGIEKVYEDYLVDKRQAQRENLKMVALGIQMSQAPPPQPPGMEGIPPELIAMLGGLGNGGNDTGAGLPPTGGGPLIGGPPNPLTGTTGP